MKGDFSRFTFEPRRHFSSVRMQQGKVQLDADWNEQAEITQHLWRTVLHDLVGPHGFPRVPGMHGAGGFAISVDPGSEAASLQAPHGAIPRLRIGAGRYYVDGLLCENEEDCWLQAPPAAPAGAQKSGHHQRSSEKMLAYLEVWDRHLSALEHPELREPALGDLETTTRTQTVWQVRLHPVHETGEADRGLLAQAREIAWHLKIAAESRVRLRVQNPSDYQGTGNHLYRVEIHTARPNGEAKFKWSRDNGSLAFKIRGAKLLEDGKTVTFTLEGMDSRAFELDEAQWVEIVDEASTLAGIPWPLGKIETLDASLGEVVATLDFAGGGDLSAPKPGALALQNPLLRFWEAPGLSLVKSGAWLPLAEGVNIEFAEEGKAHVGDYWVLPARGEMGQLLCSDQFEPALGIRRHFAPLAILNRHQGHWHVEKDCRTAFAPLAGFEAEEARSLEAIEAQIRSSAETLREEIQRLADRSNHLYYARSLQSLEPGDVVALNVELEGHVMLADRANASRVIGVVRGPAPGPDPSLWEVAIGGEVHCKVIGPVAPGDMLVPSKIPGFARRSHWFSWRGTFVAKAITGRTHHSAESRHFVKTVIALR